MPHRLGHPIGALDKEALRPAVSSVRAATESPRRASWSLDPQRFLGIVPRSRANLPLDPSRGYGRVADHTPGNCLAPSASCQRLHMATDYESCLPVILVPCKPISGRSERAPLACWSVALASCQQVISRYKFNRTLSAGSKLVDSAQSRPGVRHAESHPRHHHAGT